MKQVLFTILMIFGLHNQCLAAEEEEILYPGNSAAAPELIEVSGASFNVDTSPTAPHRNHVFTTQPEDAITVTGFLTQSDQTLLNVTCGTLDGKGLIEGENLIINTNIWHFHGTVSCNHLCRIITRSPIESVLDLCNRFAGDGTISIRQVDENDIILDEHEFHANPLLFN